jgi:two-component system response regulator PilR (NtrC family)
MQERGGIVEPDRILIVDDEEGMREFLTVVLGTEGYAVRAVSSGKEALEALAQEPYALLITDLWMPGMTGLELVEIARRQYEQLAAVVITAFASLESAIEALRLGALDYITKPFQVDEIKHTVAKALEQIRRNRKRQQVPEQATGK